MNLRLDEKGVRVRLSPAELSTMAKLGEVSATFPLGEKAAWKCELKIGSSLALIMTPNSILVSIPEEMLRCLERGIASGKKDDHEIFQPYEGMSFFLEVDYFQSRKMSTRVEEGKSSGQS